MTKDEVFDESQIPRHEPGKPLLCWCGHPATHVVGSLSVPTQSLACHEHSRWMSAWPLRPPPPRNEALERASARIDEEIAAISGRLASTMPTGLCMQTAHELAAQLRGVERAVRTLKALAIEGSTLSGQITRARDLLQQVDEILRSNQVATRKQSP